MNLLVYSRSGSSRLKYVIDCVFVQQLGWNVELIHDKDAFVASETKVKINYSNEQIQNAFGIPDYGLLSESTILPQQIEVSIDSSYPFTFFNQIGQESLSFDMFSATFYLISRYEEYLPSDLDWHWRYQSSCSLAGRHGFLEIPLVDLWITRLAEDLAAFFDFDFHQNEQGLHIIPSIDIDQAYAYVHRGIRANLLGGVKELATGRWSDLGQRLQVLAGKSPDPYDQLDAILDKLTETKLLSQSIFFIHNHNKHPFDKGHSATEKHWHQQLVKLSNKARVGLHPSYASFLDIEQMALEKKSLEAAIDRQIIHSRFHFIKMKLPDSYRALIDLGITHDHSMGYADAIGYRASTSKPFYFFDLSENQVTNLLIHPFSIMDVTMSQYLAMRPEQALNEIKSMKTVLKKTEGTIQFIWHNSSWIQLPKWHHWAPVFDELLTQ